MNLLRTLCTLASACSLAAVASVQAAVVQVNSNISVSTTWTADNTYDLETNIFVLPGATLTIEPGVVVASDPGPAGDAALIITRGARIVANGTAENPIIMTSKADVATWSSLPSHPTGKNPKTGTWRAGAGIGANEWGNLTIMGRGLVSENPTAITTNTLMPTGNNIGYMEGLTANPAQGVTAAEIAYGGNDDNDNSGSISYLSLRYGGKTLAPTVELNGLSLGGVGRGTNIDHVEVMNNLDDGIEIWGGTVNLKYINIWNVGDDSFDIDQGWRGKAQFGLIVQGYSINAGQGSGVGDNMFEIDGAEDGSAQPVTTAAIYNFTAIGQPGSNGGDQAIEFRDNARVQFRNCIIMDAGEAVIKNQNTDGETGNGTPGGYGAGGALSWAETWTTLASARPTQNAIAPTPAQGAFNHPDMLYRAQDETGYLNEVSDSVFYNNMHASAYSTANAVAMFAAANHNTSATLSPIAKLQRTASAVNPSGSLLISPVIKIDPTPVNDAALSVGAAPDDGFYTPAMYRGAFSPNPNLNWLQGWTAVDAYGILDLPEKTGVDHWTMY